MRKNEQTIFPVDISVPILPAMLGYAGLIPLVVFGVGMWFVPASQIEMFDNALLTYAACILAFMAAGKESEDQTLEQRHKAMTWAQCLKRVSTSMYRSARSALAHLMKKGALPPPPELLPATRASPDSDWFA